MEDINPALAWYKSISSKNNLPPRDVLLQGHINVGNK